MVKFLAVREGICWAVERNLDHIIVECDSLQVVQVVGSRFQGSSPMDLLVDDIRASSQTFVESQVCYVRHSANVATHGMAKLAPPDPIVEALVDVV
ncbi:hypothetical protein ACFX2B_001309 [Malus domestica]